MTATTLAISQKQMPSPSVQLTHDCCSKEMSEPPAHSYHKWSFLFHSKEFSRKPSIELGR